MACSEDRHGGESCCRDRRTDGPDEFKTVLARLQSQKSLRGSTGPQGSVCYSLYGLEAERQRLQALFCENEIK